jgi:predicted phage terminase large subunit-like protein
MSRWHEDDLVGRLLKLQEQGSYDDSEPGAGDRWEVLYLPALAEPKPDAPDPLDREWGQALVPERYDRAALLALRDDPVDGVGARAFEALYQGRPTTPEGDVFKTFWWKYAEALPYDITRWVRRWDLAATEDMGSNDPDWTAGVLMGRHPDGRFFIADARRIRGSELDVQKFVRSTAIEDRNRLGAVEIRMAQDPGQAGKSLARIYARQVLPDFDFHYEKESGSKLVRARPYAAQVENGNVFLLRGHWNADFVEEHRTFRGDGTTKDDQVDAAALAYSDLLKPRAGDGGTATDTSLDGRR